MVGKVGFATDLQVAEAESKEKDSKAKHLALNALQQAQPAAAANSKKKKKKKGKHVQFDFNKTLIKPEEAAFLYVKTKVVLTEPETFTSEDRQLLYTLMSKWALDDKICLIDLLNFDLLNAVEALKALDEEDKSFSSKVEALLKDFYNFFAASYLGLLKKQAEQQFNGKVLLAEKYFPTKERLIRDLKKFIKDLNLLNSDIKEKSKQQVASASKNKSAKLASVIKDKWNKKLESSEKQFSDIVRVLQLFIKILESKDPEAFLIRSDLSKFHGSEQLLSSDVNKNSAHLLRYMVFLEKVCDVLSKAMGNTINPFFFYNKSLAELINRLKSVKDVFSLKKKIHEDFRMLNKTKTSMEEIFMLALSGQLTHEMFCQANGIRKTQDLTQQQFISQRRADFAVLDLCLGFMTDFQRIFDDRILALKFPEEFTPSEIFARRVIHNLVNTFYAKVKPRPQKIQEGLLEIDTLSDDRKIPLKQFQIQVKEDFERILKSIKGLFSNDLLLGKVIHKWMINGIDYSLLFAASEECKPIYEALTKILDELNDLQKKHIAYLKKLHPVLNFQQMKEKKLPHFWRLICFDAALDIFPWIMMIKDLEQLYINEGEIQLINGDWHLAPIPLVDYVELTTLESELQQHVPVLKQQQLVQVNAENRERSSSFERFKIAHGAKVRKILKELYALGFIPKSIKGDHLKLVDENGQEVIVPLHKHLKPGTAQSVEDLVAGKK